MMELLAGCVVFVLEKHNGNRRDYLPFQTTFPLTPGTVKKRIAREITSTPPKTHILSKGSGDGVESARRSIGFVVITGFHRKRLKSCWIFKKIVVRFVGRSLLKLLTSITITPVVLVRRHVANVSGVCCVITATTGSGGLRTMLIGSRLLLTI